MSFLTQEQKDNFWQTGFLVMEDAVTMEELEGLRNLFADSSLPIFSGIEASRGGFEERF